LHPVKRLVYILLVAVLMGGSLFLGGCGDNPRAVSLLARADTLMADRPDAALWLLDSLLADSDRLSTHFTMQCRLRRLNACNKLDTVFTSAHVEQAKALANHFDDHGTPNEQMLAYYLLGRTFADAGEAPQAIEAYNTAADRADTTAVDCDYKTLCRVYAQKAELYYNQLLADNMIHEEQQAMKYALMAKDTMTYIYCYGMLAEGYEIKEMPDSSFLMLKEAYHLYQKHGRDDLASSLCCSMAELYLRNKKTRDALYALLQYETHTSLFDAEGNIKQGYELYYYIKGLYYIQTFQLDSAEFFFRKELKFGKDPNNQMSGFKGLQKVFEHRANMDSLTKYTRLFMEIADSCHTQVEMQDMLRINALYDYTRYEKDAQQSKLHAIRAQLRFVITAVIALLVLILAMLIAYRYREVQKKRQEEKLHYQQLLDSYRRTEKELSELRAHQGEQTLKELISQKEQELARLDAELAHYRRKAELMTVASSDEERLLRAFPFYQNLLHTTDQGHSLSANDWKAIRKFLQEHLPQFYRYMSDNSRDLTNYEYQMCLLVRLHLKPKSIANALGVDGSYVTRVRRSMVKKLFGVDASSKEADMLVLQIDQLKTTETAN